MLLQGVLRLLGIMVVRKKMAPSTTLVTVTQLEQQMVRRSKEDLVISDYPLMMCMNHVRDFIRWDANFTNHQTLVA